MNRNPSPHLAFFGLERDPFPVVPDTTHFFLPRRLETLLAEILHAIHTRKGFIVLSGEVGLGKTTLSRLVLERLEPQNVDTALLFNTSVRGPELLRVIARDFGLEPAATTEENLAALNAFLMERYEQGGNSVIVIDDAQNLDAESLELIRMVSNLETSQAKLVQILLVGQPELLEKLGTNELRQLRSRIVIHAGLTPFSKKELTQYVQYKINRAGHGGSIEIAPGALRTIHRATGGVPRRVNIFMDRCLHGLFADGGNRLERRLAREVARELEPRRHRAAQAPRRLPAAAAAIGVTVAGSLAAVLIAAPQGPVDSWLPTEIPGSWGPPRAEQTPADKGGSAAASTTAGETIPPGGDANVDAESPPLAEFAAAHGLEDYRAPLQRAVERGSVDRLSRFLAGESGHRLAVLPHQPPGGDTVAVEVESPDGGPGWLVAWRPGAEHWVETYIHGTGGPPVRKLQLQLAELQLYTGAIDGIAGPATTRAIERFQRSHGLEITGEPDAATQYLIHRPAATAGQGAP